MAVPNPTKSLDVGSGDGSIVKYTWALTTADHTGAAVHVPEHSDMTWHFSGTVGGATGIVETAPNNVDAEFAGVKNAAGGAALSIATTLPAVATSIENSLYMRPRLSVVGSGAVWTVTLVARRSNPMRH